MKKRMKNKAAEGAGSKLQEWILGLQLQLSVWLSLKCAQLSSRTLLVMLIAFCTISGAYLLLLIMGIF